MPALVFALAVAMALLCTRGAMYLFPVSYDYAELALQIGHGELQGAYPGPFLHSLLAAPLVALGVPAVRALWVLSLVSFGTCATLLFLLGRRLEGPGLGLFAAALFTLTYTDLRFANAATSEMLFLALLLAGVVATDAYAENPEPAPWHGPALGLLLALPVASRYVGVFVGPLCLAYLVLQKRQPTRPALAYGGALAALVLYYLNTLGSAAGEPMDTFGSALTSLLYEVGRAWIYLPGLFHPTPDHRTVTAVLVAVAWALLVAVSLRTPRGAFLVAPGLAYLLFFAFMASHTHIDAIDARYALPLIPFLIVAVAVAGRQRPRLKALGLLFLAVTALQGGRMVVAGYVPPDGLWSPATLQALQALPPSTTVAGSRYGRQLRTVRLDLPFVQIPFQDPFNADYLKGLELWDRRTALQAFVQEDVRAVVLFAGRENRDPYLEEHCYGSYVEELLRGEHPEAARVERLPDGVVVTLAPPERLRALRASADAGGPAPGAR